MNGNGNGNGNGVRQHKRMATGELGHGGNFDVDPFHKVNGGPDHPDRDNAHVTLGDHERAGPPHVSRGGGMMPATAHSDHGPHQLPEGSGAFGVRPLRSVQQ